MQAIQSGMQRFEALHPKLPNLPPQAFNTLANQAQQLHEEFLTLQRKGIQLAGDGRQPMLEADAAPYADQLESFVARQINLVNEAEQQVQQLGGAGGYQGMLGTRLPSVQSTMPGTSMPQMQASPASAPGQVTPTTDAKLSAVIDKVIRLMQEFQGILPQLSRVSQQAIAPLANVGTSSVVSVVETDTTVSEARDLVLLDVREGDEFDQCHLPLAVSYPAPKINRDQFIPELLRCKRDPGKLLVVYGANEQATIGVAKLLVEKGWENVHALSGGFEEMIQSYPEVLEGTVPDRPLTTSTTRSAPRR